MPAPGGAGVTLQEDTWYHIAITGDPAGNIVLYFNGDGIATAAYGTPMAEEIQVLREFRDQILMKSEAGRVFIDIYYEYSPPIAEFIKDKPLLRAKVRAILKPAILVSEQIVE